MITKITIIQEIQKNLTQFPDYEIILVNDASSDDTKNVINVYSRSGNAYDDGFLTDPALSSEIVAANGQTYVDLYRNVNLENRQHYMSDFGLDVFARPQVVKMGVAVNF